MLRRQLLEARGVKAFDLPGVGIACYNDDVATTLLSAATLRGWAVPHDVGLVGMDNTPLSAVTVPPLTTVGYDLSAVAYNLITGALSGIGEEVTDRELADAHFALTERGSS